MLRLRFALAAVLVVTAACSTNSASTASGDRVARNPNVISLEELRDPAIIGNNAQYAVQQLRPAFFRTRGSQTMRNTDPSSTPGSVRISQDFGPLQAVGNLAGIDVRTLVEIRYLDAVEAQARFGINANGGPVIVLLSSKQ